MSQIIVQYLQPVRSLPGGEQDPFANKIRVTPDGRISVLDVISVVCFMAEDGTFIQKASAQASHYLSRIEKDHSEVTTICRLWKFPGARQRDTPVTDRQGVIKIIQLLPGKKAATFRHSMAVLLEKYLDADPGLIQDLHERYREKTGEEFTPLPRQQVTEAPRIKACEKTKLDMRAIKDSSSQPVPARLYAIVNNNANKLATGYEYTADYRRDQGLTKKSQATRDTFTDGMCSLTEFFHQRHLSMVSKGGDPEKAAMDIVEALTPGLKKLGHYEEAREYRGPEFAAKNKRLMLSNQAWNRDGRIRLAA